MEKQKRNHLWLNSLCCHGLWLHDFLLTDQFENGVVEVCTRCGLRKFFHNQVNNYEYLSWHLRSALQKSNVRFSKEYEEQLN